MNKIIQHHAALRRDRGPAARRLRGGRPRWASSRSSPTCRMARSAAHPTSRQEARAGGAGGARLPAHPHHQGRRLLRARGRRHRRMRCAICRGPCWRTARRACARRWPGRLPPRAASRSIACWRVLRPPASIWMPSATNSQDQHDPAPSGPIPPALDAERCLTRRVRRRSDTTHKQPPDLARRRGSSSRSNQGLAVSQALLRQEGCGSGTRRGRRFGSRAARASA